MKKNPSIMTISELSEPSRHGDDQDGIVPESFDMTKKSNAMIKHEFTHFPRTCPTEQDDTLIQTHNSDFQEDFRRFEQMVDYDEALIQEYDKTVNSVIIDVFDPQKLGGRVQNFKSTKHKQPDNERESLSDFIELQELENEMANSRNCNQFLSGRAGLSSTATNPISSSFGYKRTRIKFQD